MHSSDESGTYDGSVEKESEVNDEAELDGIDMQIGDETDQTDNFDTSSQEQSSTVSSVEKAWESLAAVSHDICTDDESGNSPLHVSLAEEPNISTSATATKKQTIAVPVKRSQSCNNSKGYQPMKEEREKKTRKGAWSIGSKPMSAIEMDREFVNTLNCFKKVSDDESRQLKHMANKDGSDDDHLFCLSLVGLFRHLDPHHKIMAKFQIMKIFHDIESAKGIEKHQEAPTAIC